MKYTCEIVIDKPVDEVIALFDDPDNMKEWQPGFLGHESVSGTPGQPGAKTRLSYRMGSRDIEMTETILTRNLPEEFSCTYETNGVYNIVKNTFESMDGDKTRWITYQKFKFSGFMKIIAFFMPGQFRKQSMKYMELFKEFAES